MKARVCLAALLTLACFSPSPCFAQGAASPGGGASGGAGPGVGGSGGATGGISGGGISMGGISGGISGGGVTNHLGVSGNQGLNSTIGTSGMTRGMHPPSLGSVLSPGTNSSMLPRSFPPASSIWSPSPYSPPRQELRDPFGVNRSGAGNGAPRSRFRLPPPSGPRKGALVHALDGTIENHDIRKGAAYFPRKGMYEDMIYHHRRGTFQAPPRRQGVPAHQGASSRGAASQGGL